MSVAIFEERAGPVKSFCLTAIISRRQPLQQNRFKQGRRMWLSNLLGVQRRPSTNSPGLGWELQLLCIVSHLWASSSSKVGSSVRIGLWSVIVNRTIRYCHNLCDSFRECSQRLAASSALVGTHTQFFKPPHPRPCSQEL